MIPIFTSSHNDFKIASNWASSRYLFASFSTQKHILSTVTFISRETFLDLRSQVGVIEHQDICKVFTWSSVKALQKDILYTVSLIMNHG